MASLQANRSDWGISLGLQILNKMATEIEQPSALKLSPRQPSWFLFGLVVIAAAAIRLVGISKDLWLDEIWSLQVASGLRSPVQVFTLHHEINHYLNTLWLYWIGQNGSSFEYHLLSFVCGVASVVMATVIASRRNVASGWIAFGLFAFSYELVAYSTEARGYASLVLWALVAFDALERYTISPRPLWAVLYSAACVLGIVSQPIFAAFIAAAAAASTYRFLRTDSLSRAVRTAILLHGVPLLAILTLWWIDLRLVQPGGGNPQSLLNVYGTALAWTVGTMQSPFVETVSCLLAVVIICLGLRRMRDNDRIFFLGAIVAFPLLLLVVRRSALVYTRHFMISAVFLLLLFSSVLGEWWQKGHRLTCVVIIGGYLGINVWNIRQFAQNGRGEYGAALQDIVDHTPGSFVSIAGDQDFMVGTEVRYYLPRVLAARQGAYLERSLWPGDGPQWVIVQRESFAPATPPVDRFGDGKGNTFEFFKTYPAAPLSGLHWFVYRNRMLALK